MALKNIIYIILFLFLLKSPSYSQGIGNDVPLSISNLIAGFFPGITVNTQDCFYYESNMSLINENLEKLKKCKWLVIPEDEIRRTISKQDAFNILFQSLDSCVGIWIAPTHVHSILYVDYLDVTMFYEGNLKLIAAAISNNSKNIHCNHVLIYQPNQEILNAITNIHSIKNLRIASKRKDISFISAYQGLDSLSTFGYYGVLPNHIHHLSKIENFYAYENKNEFPAVIGNIKTIKTLYLSTLIVSDSCLIPTSFSNLTNLRTLSIVGNFFDLKFSLDSINKLENLILSVNNVEIISKFINIKTLKTLTVKATGYIPVDLYDLTKLEILKVNFVTNIQLKGEISSLKYLNKLVLQGDGKVSGFRNLKKIKKSISLSLFGNIKFDRDEILALSKNKKIREMEISFSIFKDIEAEKVVFKNIKFIRIVDNTSNESIQLSAELRNRISKVFMQASIL